MNLIKFLVIEFGGNNPAVLKKVPKPPKEEKKQGEKAERPVIIITVPLKVWLQNKRLADMRNSFLQP